MFSKTRTIYEQILNADSNACQIRSPKNRIVAANTAGNDLFGTGENPFSFLKNALSSDRIQKLVDAYCTLTPLETEISTEMKTYRITLARIRKNILLTAKDITAERAIYHSLTHQLNFVSDILNNFAGALYLTDKNGAIVYVNQSFCTLVNAPVKEVLDKNLSKFIIENIPDFNGVWEGVSLIAADNGPTLFHITQKPFETGSNVFFLGSIRPFTPTTTSSSLFLFHNSPIPSMMLDVVENRIQHVNTAFLATFKAADNAFHQAALGDIFTEHSADLLKSRLTKLLGGPIKNDRFELITKPNFDEKTFNTFVGFAGPEKDMYIVYLIDATERKNLELQFAHSQKMQAMGQLAGGVAHDFNNLLTAIIGFSDLLLTRHGLGDQSFNDINQIKSNAGRAAGLVGQLLTFSRKQPSRIQTLAINDAFVDLSGLLQRTIAPFVKLKTDIKRNLGNIKIDKNQFTQIFLNLAVNAKDAMPKGGTFTIAAGKEKIKKAKPCGPDMMTAGDYIKIVVTDTGCGIDKKHLPHIFEPFFTTKEDGKSSGTGLGLSTVYGIIRGVGGFISVDSEKKIGTTFIVYLPRFDAPANTLEAEAKPIRSTQAPTAETRILLVDDEDAVRAVSSRALKSKGYIVTECANAEQALEELKKDDAHFDLLLTDVVMPGMNGEELSLIAKETRPEIKIILMSGYSEDFARHGSEQSATFSFLAKPFSLADLLEKVKDVLEQPVRV